MMLHSTLRVVRPLTAIGHSGQISTRSLVSLQNIRARLSSISSIQRIGPSMKLLTLTQSHARTSRATMQMVRALSDASTAPLKSSTPDAEELASDNQDHPNANANANAGQINARANLRNLDRVFASFEDRCQRIERVTERDFIRTFNTFIKAVDSLEELDVSEKSEAMPNITIYSCVLLRCCGSLMLDTPHKGRELLAGNLWTFIKEKNIPLNVSHYNTLIKVLNDNQTTFDPKKILEEMAGHNSTPDRVTYQRLIHQYCLQGDIQGATNLLETMKDAGMELNEATFASLITGYFKQETPPPIMELFDLMRSNNIEPDSKSYAAALIAQADRMTKEPESASAEIAKLQQLMEKEEIEFSSNEIIDLITNLAPYKKSNEVVDKIFNSTLKSLERSMPTRYRILSTLIKANLFQDASDIFWSQNITERALRAGQVGMYYIRALGIHRNVSIEFALEEAAKMQEKGWNTKAMHSLYYCAAETGRLDLVRAIIKQIAQDEPLKVLYLWPLLAQSKTNEELVEVLKNDLSPTMEEEDLLETFSMWVWPRFVDEPLKLFQINKDLLYDSNMLMASFLNYSVQVDKIVEAVKFISEAPPELVGKEESADSGGDEDSEGESSKERPQSRNITERSDLVGKLLNQIIEETKDPELVKKAFNMCKLPKQQISLRCLGALVKVHLVNNDFNQALKEFLRIAGEYRLTPCRSELMEHCLVNKDPENLQKVMNAVSEIFGEQNSLFDLAVCCLKANKLKQAQKIFASPGFRVRPPRVYQAARNFAQQGQVQELENFVSLTRDMFDINQEYLYQILLDTYERKGNAERALHLWNMMQEEDLQPSKKSLVMIANTLERHNIDVPFQKPRLNFPGRIQSGGWRVRSPTRNQRNQD